MHADIEVYSRFGTLAQTLLTSRGHVRYFIDYLLTCSCTKINPIVAGVRLYISMFYFGILGLRVVSISNDLNV